MQAYAKLNLIREVAEDSFLFPENLFHLKRLELVRQRSRKSEKRRRERLPVKLFKFKIYD